MRDGLEAVPLALAVSQRARQLIRQNFALAILYNAIALPFALAGFVTPLVAALAHDKRAPHKDRPARSLGTIAIRCAK